MTIADEKSRLRLAARERRRRAAADPATTTAAATVAAHAALLPPHLLPPELGPGATVSAYWPMKDEIDPGPLARRLVARGATLALPYVAGGRMGFRSAGALVAGPFGTMEPGEGPELVPELLLVPLLAFTRDGTRLGYGKGYYDGWLAAHPGRVAIGIAYAAQELDALPLEPHDVPLAAILTEREAIVTGVAAAEPGR